MNVNEFQVGEYVQIREDLKDCDGDELPTINDSMLELAGTIRRIDDLYTDTGYLSICDWVWLPKWVRKIGDEEESPIKINVDTLL